MTHSSITQTTLNLVSITCLLAACGGSSVHSKSRSTPQKSLQDTQPNSAAQTTDKERPPSPGTIKSIEFPNAKRSQLANGLRIAVTPWHSGASVYLHAVIHGGDAADPKSRIGLASIASRMLNEGTQKSTAEQLANRIAHLGAQLSIGSTRDYTQISIQALSEHTDKAFALLSEILTQPRFSAKELKSFKVREQRRLKLAENNPNYLATKVLYKTLYGDHPYANVDIDPEMLSKLTTVDLKKWHRENVRAGNVEIFVSGKADALEIQSLAKKMLSKIPKGSWKKAPSTPLKKKALEVFLLDRPESVQSVISLGNLAIKRNHPDYIQLRVANQVLGGSAASRLFMDLREKRSLSYGAYSNLISAKHMAPLRIQTSVRSEKTLAAIAAIFENVERIHTEEVPHPELLDAQRFLADSFPLKIDTAAKIAELTAALSVFELPEKYWDTYASSIRNVTPEQVMDMAKQYIAPGQGALVIVGRAAGMTEALKKYGPVNLLDEQGNLVKRIE